MKEFFKVIIALITVAVVLVISALPVVTLALAAFYLWKHI